MVHHKEYLAIMGPSGSGKSTLLNILGILDQPTSGTYLLDGIDTTSMSDNLQADVRRNKIGFVFQSFHLISRLTAAENIGLPLTLAGIPPKQRDSRVRDVLESVGLTERAEHRPDQLSGGQRQRVAIARATIMRPTILLADEPTGNLDQSSGESVIKVLEELNDQGIILLVVTHDPDIGGRARRRIHMVDGRISKDER
jgi:putative ABC transport system ATP-binding protein